MKAFQDEKHEGFILSGGRAGALLIHGFPGTPAEMRPLADSLCREGWTVEGLLLPGFGAQIDTLNERHHEEWIDSVSIAMERLRRQCDRILLVGYSMGAAISLQVAAGGTPPDGLVLLAPFWQLGERWQQPVWPLLKLIVRKFKPFEKADFSDPQVKRDLSNFMDDADLDDPETRRFIRQISLPFSLLDQVREVGKVAYRNAPKVNAPAIVVQGTDDDVVHPAKTRRLLRRLTGEVSYYEVHANHHLIRPEHSAFADVEAIVLQFARQFI